MDKPIPKCPACKKDVEFSDEELENYDGHHLEKVCPHCENFCCFTCEHIYGNIKEINNEKYFTYIS